MYPESYLSNTTMHLKSRNAYVKFTKAMWNLLIPKIKHGYMDEVLEFETSLARVTRPLVEQRNLMKYYQRMSVREFANQTNIPHQWLVQVLSETSLQSKRFMSLDEQIASVNTVFIAEAYRLFSNLSEGAKEMYFVWQGVQYMVPVVMGPYRSTLLEYYNTIASLKDTPPPWELCVDRTVELFGYALAAPYVNTVYDVSRSERVRVEIN